MDDRLSGDSGRVKVIDDFFEDFEEFRRYLDLVYYEGEVNPADGVFYPGVSTDIPPYFKLQVRERVGIEPRYLFLRLSPEGQATPHQAHHDAIMAKQTMIVYLNREEHCQGGTSLVEHVEYGKDVPDEIWVRDTKNPEMWTVSSELEMKPNRAVIYPSEIWHRSEPIGGFGDVPRNARLVMVGFFDGHETSETQRSD